MGETERMTLRMAVNTALREEMDRDETVFIMGEDIAAPEGGAFGMTKGLVDEYGPDRVRDTPISEAGFVGAGVGAAATGSRPILEIGFVTFTGVAFEQIHNQMTHLRYMFGGKTDMPIVVRAAEGAGMNASGQHSKTLHTVFAHLPGAKVVTASTPASAKGLLKSSIRSDDPVFFFEDKAAFQQEGPVPVDEDYTIPIGSASVERVGEDVTVVATQRYVDEGIQAAEAFADDASVEVIDLRSLYPLDTETIVKSVEKTGRLVVADGSPLSYGVHAEVITRVVENAFFSLDAPVQRVGTPDTPIPFSPSMEDEVVPAVDDIERAIRRIV